MANVTHERHLLIIASDPGKAGRLVEACRRIDAQALYTPDPIHGLIQAMHDAPAMLLIDSDDAWLGDVSVIQEVRRHPALCFTPIMLLTENASELAPSRGVKDGADFITDLDAPDLAGRIRACFKTRDKAPPNAWSRPSALKRAARAAKAVAVKMSSHLGPGLAPRPTLTVALGDLMCDGNLFRRIGDASQIYELQITRDNLMLIPIQQGLASYCFEDAETLLENFQFLPFA